MKASQNKCVNHFQPAIQSIKLFENFYEIAIGRELKMKELKKKVEALEYGLLQSDKHDE